MRRPVAIRCCLVVVLFAAAMGLGAPRVGAQARAPIDLAAATIRPGDLPDAGWGHEGAFMESPESLANGFAAYWGRGTAAADVRARLDAFGWQRMYIAELSNTSAARGRIRSYVTQYADGAGAAAGFAYLEDERLVPTASDVAGTRIFGEASEITRDQGTSAVDGAPFVSLDLTFRSGALVGGVTLILPAGGAGPQVAAVEALGAMLERRLQDPPAEPGLGLRVARVSDGATGVTTYDDAYYRLGGAAVPLAGESASAASARIASYAEAADVYQLWQGIDVGTADGVLYGITLLRFPDETTAGAWVAGLAETLGQNAFYGDLRPLQAPTRLGDEAVALRYVAGGGGAADPHAVLVAVRVGTLVARVHVVPQGRPSDVRLETVLPLAERQADCLGGAGCAAYDAVPDALGGQPAATPTA